MIDSRGEAGGGPEGAEGAWEDHAAAGFRGATLSQAEYLDRVMTDTEQFSFEANRLAARRLASIGHAIRVARENPHIYVLPELMTRSEAREWAVRAAATELSMRLLIPTATVLNEAAEAHTLAARLPKLWLEFLDGATSYPIVRAAVETITGWDDDDAVARFDTELAGVAGRVTVASFRGRAKRLRDRLSAATLSERHRRALTERRVVFEDAPEGMMWLHALLPALDGVKIRTRLNATAKHASKVPGETRTRDQLRADHLADWLTGTGTPTAVQTRVLVTVPLIAGLLEKPARDARSAASGPPATAGSATTGCGAAPDFGSGAGPTPGSGTVPKSGSGSNSTNSANSSPGSDRPAPASPAPSGAALPAHPWLDVATIDGYGPISTETARHIFDTATAFRRLIVDPITAEPLHLDRTHYRPSQAQRDWLTLTYQRCSRPGCNHLAATADIDHITDWANGGNTNIDNLAPLCPPDHRLKHVTWLGPRLDEPDEPDETDSTDTDTGPESETGVVEPGSPDAPTRPRNTAPRWTSPTGYTNDTEIPPF